MMCISFGSRVVILVRLPRWNSCTGSTSGSGYDAILAVQII
ncbi:hypothetical protein OROHE_022809 [Orobanche hederae]